MTATNPNPQTISTQLINGVLGFKPLFNLAKHQARQMMIKRSEKIGVPWKQQVAELQQRNWDADLAQVQNPQVQYPDYYVQPFHAYDQGNLSWESALEVEVAAYTVHSGIWKGAGKEGDVRLRRNFLEVLQAQIPQAPKDILDLGCSVGMSTFVFREIYPEAKLTGVDLSPYFLAVAKYNSQQRNIDVNWVHAAAESTGLPDASFDLVSLCLVFHELPQTAAKAIIQEARRLLRPGGHLAIMDMNPQSEVYAKMPPYVLTLLKSTEPWFDEYFSLDLDEVIAHSGFTRPTITPSTPRHRTIVAQAI